MYTVKAAVEAANGSTSGADLAAVMPTITVEGVTGTMTWSADGNTNKAASAILYKNGVGTLFGQDNANDAAARRAGTLRIPRPTRRRKQMATYLPHNKPIRPPGAAPGGRNGRHAKE